MKRPFRGLRNRPPAAHYDAVVIGAGIGGLFCANLLAKDGLKVLLIEQHYMLGGYCSTFRRAGYTFDAATHFYPLLGNPATITGRVLADLGIRTEWVKMDPVDTFHFPDGTRFVVPADFETYRQSLRTSFPHEDANLDRFFEAVNEAYLLGLLFFFRGRATPRFEAYRDLTVREVLDRYFQDEKLKLLLTADCPHWGSPPNRTSFVFDSMLRLSYFLGNYYPVMGSQAFADDLGRAFEERGGDIMIHTRAERILLDGDRACGVEVSTGRGRLEGRYRVTADAVVSNADLVQTLDHLLPERTAVRDYRAEVGDLKPSFPCFLSHLGIRDVSADVLDEAQGYYWRHWDPDRVGRDGLICKVFVPTLYEPRMAPEGGHVIILQKVQEIDYEGVADWPTHKADVETFVTDHLAKVIPGIRERIVVQTSASAHTSWRFTLNTTGSMLGWEMSPEQLGDRRPAIEGPLPGLFLVGHWTKPGGGITPVIISAVQTAAAIVRGRPHPEPPLEDLVGASVTRAAEVIDAH